MSLKRFCGKIAVVTASTSGIGYSIAERLAREGAKVLISSRTEKSVEEAKKNLRDQGLDVEGSVCNVSNPDDRRKLLQEAKNLGGLDILVNNAGVNPKVALCGVYDCPESAWDKLVEVNLKTSYLLTKESLPLLRQSNAGRVIYLSSSAVNFPQEKLGAYAVSKTALQGLARMGALHLAKDNITVNCVSPGIIPTTFSQVLSQDSDHFLPKIPLKRFGKVEEVSGVVAFLASEDGGYITGEAIVINGGPPL